jgi:hypothetical protein
MTARRRKPWRCIVWAASLWAAASVAFAETAEFTLDEVRALAAQALAVRRADIARDLAMGLLKADPEDAFAYAVLASAHSQLGDPGLARSAARLTYKYADGDANKFTAARAAGQMAYTQKRHIAAQYWLRRAAIHSDTEAQDRALKRDYSAVRQRSPWSAQLRVSLAPSNNVNNGADSNLDTVDGDPLIALIRPSSQALSGTVGTLDGQIGYRLHGAEGSATTLGARYYERRVWLSDEAKAAAPTLSDSDFTSRYANVSLDHAFRLGQPGNFAGLRATFGSVWSAGDKTYDFTEIDARRGIRTGPRSRLSVSVAGEWRESAISNSRDAKLVRLGLGVSHKLGNGDTTSLSLRGSDVTADALNGTYQTWTFRAGYAFAKPLGPANVTAGLTFGETDYDSYIRYDRPTLQSRTDTEIAADLNFVFNAYDYAGFAPTVTMRARKTESNVNRFDTEEVSVSWGVQSKF